MKIRKGFVSNSSSSSYVCDITGNVESGWDMGIEDAEMYQCECGHTFLEEYILEATIENKIAILRKTADNYSIDEICIILNAEEITERNKVISLSYLYDSELEKINFDITFYNRYEIPTCLCPICMMEHIPDYSVLHYLVKECGKTKEEVIDEIKKKFRTCDDLYNYCKE